MVELKGKIIIKGNIIAKTGLYIGGMSTGLDIGGIDNLVVRDPITKRPYIPGSSIKGKLRSILEKAEGKVTDDERIWVKKPDDKGLGGISIHMCNDRGCPICNIFGRNEGEKERVKGSNKLMIESKNVTPTRLIVRDVELKGAINLETNEEVSLEKLREIGDLPYTEAKTEVVIDRVTSAANPRQMERVPAGARFEFEMIYNIFDEEDKTNLKKVFESMSLLEQDYLGGQGSRGYGKVEFDDIKIYWNPKSDYETGNTDVKKKTPINDNWTNVTSILQNFDNISETISLSD